jgi:single-stranded-DNA-specific exonuclease
MAKRWRIRPHDPDRIAALQREANVSAVVAQLLIARSICDARQAQEFLNPKLSGLRDPEQLPGVSEAADRLMQAIRDARPIVVYGDYDADGITGTAVLFECLTLLGAKVGYYVPHRIDEGYGLNDEALRTLAARGAAVVVTVDCGIASLSQAETARDLGLELIVTDHHEFAERLPAAAAIVHPRLPGTAYPFAGLSGSGVAFKLAWAICQRANEAKKVSPRMRSFLVQAVGLAAIGTVADVVPLLDENRILVRHGLASLAQDAGLGMQRLMKLTGLHEKTCLDCEDIGFTLAPRINAAGRLGQAQLAVELLTTTSTERAAALAEYLHELNSSRESLERSVYLAASKQAQEQFDPENDAALVLAGRDWHPGVIGIVAGRLAEKHHRPVVMIALDGLGVKPAIGSVRGVPGFHVHQALAECSEHLTSHGGHSAAGGLKIEEQRIDGFREDFCQFAAGVIRQEDRVAELWIDSETPFSALTMQTVEQIEQLAPFGQGNQRPVLSATDVRLAEPPKRIGGGGRHLSLRLVQHGVKLRGVAFGGGDWAVELGATSGPLSLAFRPIINSFNGRRTVELHVADWRCDEAASAACPMPAPAIASR